MKDFIFDGQKGKDNGLIMCNIDTNAGVTRDNIISNSTFVTIRPAGSAKVFFSNNKYETQLTKQIDLCLFDFESCQPKKMTKWDVEEIQRWLCRTDGYHPLTLVDDNELENLIYNAKFDITAIELGDDIIGLQCTITTDSPYGYTNLLSVDKDMDGINTLTIADSSSATGSMRVNMIVTCKDSGDYIITNKFNNKSTILMNCSASEVITLTDSGVLTTSDKGHDIADDFNYVFPEIHNTIAENDNIFTCNKKCNIKITYQARRKVGL